MSLALVEPAPPSTGYLVDRSIAERKAGRDPLGLQTITQDRITVVLLPAILVNSSWARYFSFTPLLLLEFEEQRFPKPRAHVRFMPGALSKSLSITFLLLSPPDLRGVGFPKLMFPQLSACLSAAVD
jgi:hypothetical protein